LKKDELAALPKGTKLYCVLRHKSRSGMLRIIDLFRIITDDRPEYPPDIRYVRVFHDEEPGFPFKYTGFHDRYEGYHVRGCGMDMGFHLVYELSQWATGDPYHFVHMWV